MQQSVLCIIIGHFASCFVNVISNDEADWVQDPAVQLIIQSSNKDKDSG